MADEITIGKEVAGVRTGLGGLIDTIKSSAKETEIAYGEHRKAIQKITEDSKKPLEELDDGLVKTGVALRTAAGDVAAKAGTLSGKIDQAWTAADKKLADGMVGLDMLWMDLTTTPDFAIVFDEMWAKMPDVGKTLNAGSDAIKELTGGVIDIAIRQLLDLPRRGQFDLWTLNTSLTEFIVDDTGVKRGRWTLIRYNDHAHLAGLPFATNEDS